MAITAQQMRDLMVEHGWTVRMAPDGSGWVARAREGDGRLHRGVKATPEEAVEAAEIDRAATADRSHEALKARGFDALSVGRYFARSRVITVNDPDGNPVQARVWDIFNETNTKIINAKQSLAAAVIDAEQLLGPAP